MPIEESEKSQSPERKKPQVPRHFMLGLTQRKIQRRKEAFKQALSGKGLEDTFGEERRGSLVKQIPPRGPSPILRSTSNVVGSERNLLKEELASKPPLMRLGTANFKNQRLAKEEEKWFKAKEKGKESVQSHAFAKQLESGSGEESESEYSESEEESQQRPDKSSPAEAEAKEIAEQPNQLE